jgi:hypothetical protein
VDEMISLLQVLSSFSVLLSFSLPNRTADCSPTVLIQGPCEFLRVMTEYIINSIWQGSGRLFGKTYDLVPYHSPTYKTHTCFVWIW